MERFSFGDYQLNRMDGELLFKGEALKLEPQVFCILELLITQHGRVVSRDEIIKEVWDGRFISKHVLDNRIRAARAAIGDTDKVKRFIKTYPNRGYKFVGEVTTLNSNGLSPDQEDCEQLRVAKQQSVKRPLVRSWLLPKFILPGALCLFLALFVIQPFSGKMWVENIPKSGLLETFKAQDVYDEKDLPRIGVLPFEKFGENSRYSFLPDVLESEFNQTITAVSGLTVVSFYSKTATQDQFFEYNDFREEFDLDYVIASELSYYEDVFKLNVSLVRTEDDSVLANETYDLDVSSDADPVDFFASIAPKITLMTANTLNLPLGALPNSWKNYAFYAKIEEAELLIEAADYESVKKAVGLLREVVEEEPSYLPAYSKLIFYLSLQMNFIVDDNDALHKEQAELAIKMKEISPGAPDTLMNNALMGTMSENGVYKPAVGEPINADPVSIMKYVLEKDPDNLLAMSGLAFFKQFLEDPAETVQAYEKALQLSPTDAWVLPNYSRALFCNQEYEMASKVIERTAKWHPNHRKVLVAQLQQANGFGNYEVSIKIVLRLLDQGIISQEETNDFVTLFHDLGHLELTLPHIRFPPTKAYVHAVLGNNETALAESKVIERFYTSVSARMIADTDYLPEDYVPDMSYLNVGEVGDTTRANPCRLDHLLRDTFVYKKKKSEKYEPYLTLIKDFFEGRDPASFVTRQEFTAFMGLHMLQGDHDKAIEIMDLAMDRGFLFIGSFKEPFLRDLTTHPGFSERLEKMQRSADRLIEEFHSN